MANMTLNDMVGAVLTRHAELSPVDRVDQLDKFQWKPDGGGQLIRLTAEGETPEEPIVILPRAKQQICERLKVPVAFFDRLPAKLQWAVMNYLIQDKDNGYAKQATMRLVHGLQMRAFLSPNFSAFDDVDLLPMVADALADEDGAEVTTLDQGDDLTTFRIIFPRDIIEPRVGDVVRAGLHGRNSATGCAAFKLDSYTDTLRCLNGMTASQLDTRLVIRHIGAHDRLKDQVVRMVRDARRNTAQLMAKMRAAVDVAINEPIDFINKQAEKAELTQDQLKAVLTAFAVGEHAGDSTLYGIAQAFTAGAKQTTNMDLRYQLERVGGDLVMAA